MDENKMINAKKMYDAVCAMLDSRNFKYEKIEEKLLVRFFVGGNDIPMNFIMRIDAERSLVVLTSLLPGSFPEERRELGAVATSEINFSLADGNFDYDLSDGTVYFRITSSYLSSLISQAALEYMLECSIYTVDKFNDKLFMLANGMVEIEKFLEML